MHKDTLLTRCIGDEVCGQVTFPCAIHNIIIGKGNANIIIII